jgi:hypothetical protein
VAAVHELIPDATCLLFVLEVLKVVSQSSQCQRKTWVTAWTLFGGSPMGFPSRVHHFATEMLVLPQPLHVRPGKSLEISPNSSSVASSNVPSDLVDSRPGPYKPKRCGSQASSSGP